jgi:hypothetical protein
MRIFRRGKRGTWYAEYRDPVTGREVRESLRVRNKRVAQDMAREKAGQVARRHHRLAERKPWGEAVDAFLKDGAVHKDRVTVAEDRRTLKGTPARGSRLARPARFQLPELVRHVDEVRPDHVTSYVASRKVLGRSPFRINRELRTLRAFFNWCSAPARRWTSENPARQVRELPEPRGIAARCMTDEQIGGLLKQTEGTRLEGLVLLALQRTWMTWTTPSVAGAVLVKRRERRRRWDQRPACSSPVSPRCDPRRGLRSLTHSNYSRESSRGRRSTIEGTTGSPRNASVQERGKRGLDPSKAT